MKWLRLVDLAACTFIILWVIDAAYSIVSSGNIIGSAVGIPNVYAFHAYPVFIWAGFFFYFRWKKFHWAAPYVFAIAIAVNGEIFNQVAGLVHGSILVPDAIYWFRVYVDFASLILSVVILVKLGYRMKIGKWTGWPALIILGMDYAFVVSLGYPATTQPGYGYNPLLNVIDVVGLVLWPLFFYSSITKPELPSVG